MTDAEKREKVIKGLECCAHEEIGDCNNCPYNENTPHCDIAMMRDAIALLKAQEPRIVTLAELTFGEPMLVWLEDKDKKDVVAGMIFDYVPGRFGFKLTDIGGMDRIYPLIDEYFTRWRAWTSRPTDAQREAVKWE